MHLHNFIGLSSVILGTAFKDEVYNAKSQNNTLDVL